MDYESIDITNYFLLKGIWRAFKPKRKKQFFLCTLLMIISGIAETLSIASIIPLINFLTSPNSIWENQLIFSVFTFLGFSNLTKPLIPIFFLFTISVIFAGLLRIFTLWIISKFIAALTSDFSTESFLKNLYQPYSVHISKNSSEIIALNTVEINQLGNVFTYFMKMLLSISYVFFILSAVFLFDTRLALISFFIFILIYFALTLVSRFYLKINSQFISKSRERHIKFLNEGLGSIKEIILNNNYNFYIKNFLKIDNPMRKKMAENDFISNAPRALVETIAFIYLAFLSLYVVLTSVNGLIVLSKIAVIAIACQKVLPQLQQIYASWTRLSGNSKAIEKILYSINQSIPKERNSSNEKLEFKKYIILKEVYFKYKDTKRYILKGINLKISKSEKIGIIGQTGSGKSTLVDIIIGLLRPTKGDISVDEVNISSDKAINFWRSLISYIPQDIYLSDSTIIENIASGVKKEDIDTRKIIKSAKKAQIHDFIKNLPMGYKTNIGEMGIKLSGGQRQRIGIARAIYNIYDKNKKILILDEATSALDYEVEDLIIKSIYEIRSDLTLIMISHRLNTLQNCDRILEIKNGSILSDRMLKII